MAEKDTVNLPPPVKITHNPSVPTVFSDTVNVAIRRDGMVLLQFGTLLPQDDQRVEAARVVITQEHLERLKALLQRLSPPPEPQKKSSKG